MKKVAEEVRGNSTLRMYVQKSVEAQKLRKESNKLARIKNRQTAMIIKEKIQKKEDIVMKKSGFDIQMSASKTQMKMHQKSQNQLHQTTSQISFNGNSPENSRIKEQEESRSNSPG